jgi:hypothetical protein
MRTPLRRVRDVLAVLFVVWALSFIAGAPTASYDVPSPLSVVGEADADAEASFADDAEITAGSIEFLRLIAVGIMLSALLLVARAVLTIRDRGPPAAPLTVSPVTVLGA